jgi:ubiquinone biosynthesis protein COQ9
MGEQSEEGALDWAVRLMLPHVPDLGWTRACLAAALEENGRPASDAALAFTGGGRAVVNAYFDFVDRRMSAGYQTLDTAGLRLPARVRAVYALRFAQCHDEKQAYRRALAALELPKRQQDALRARFRTVDLIWHLVGDRSTDFSWYTKRATLGIIHATTTLFWLTDVSEDNNRTLAYLDRALAAVARFGKFRGAVTSRLYPRPG